MTNDPSRLTWQTTNITTNAGGAQIHEASPLFKQERDRLLEEAKKIEAEVEAKVEEAEAVVEAEVKKVTTRKAAAPAAETKSE